MLTIVFDLDGTLIDTAPDLISTLNFILANEGLPPAAYDDARCAGPYCAGGEPERAIMVGDSGTDVRTARAAAVPIVAVDFSYGEVPIAQLKPDRLIGSFAELPPVIADIEGRGILTAERALSPRDNEHPAAQPFRTEPRGGRDT